MSPSVLVVDPDRAFATVLVEAIKGLGNYEALAVASLEEAQAALRERPYTLAIVDASAMDVPPRQCAETLRTLQPGLRLMLIQGEDEGAPEGIPVQGLLPKPFFTSELPDLLGQALKQPWPVPSRGAPEPHPPPGATPPTDNDVKGVLAALCRETKALSAFVMAGGEILAQAGSLPPDALDPLSQATIGMETSLQEVAEAVREDAFQQIILEGAGTRLSLFQVVPGVTLVVLTRSETPLGILRFNARQACRETASRL